MGHQIQVFTGLYQCPSCGNQYDCLRLRAEDLVCHRCATPLEKVGPIQIWIRRYPDSMAILHHVEEKGT